jgi:hypothetical protein
LTKSVAILGCGPAGLLVAHAAELSNWDFKIYSLKRKSPIFGAQYLHEPILDLQLPDPVMLSYKLDGTPEEYRQKVYGPSWDGQTSPEDYEGSHLAWDLREAYEQLWFEYGSEVQPIDLASIPSWILYEDLTKRQTLSDGHDLVISTVPRTVFDGDDSNFERTNVWALGDSDHQRVFMYRPPSFTVQCDGTKTNQWYRVSNIFGYCTMEWPQWWNTPFASVTPPARGAQMIAKPLRYTGSAAQDLIHLGRYAQWQKGVLTSDVFKASMEVFREDSI